MYRDLTDHLLTYKDFAESTGNKISTLEESFRTLKFDTQKKIAELEEMIRKLRDGQSGSSGKPSVVVSSSNTSAIDYSADIKSIQATLKEHSTKIDELSKSIKGLQGSVANDINDLKSRVQSLETTSNDHRSRIQALEDELADLKGLKGRVIFLLLN